MKAAYQLTYAVQHAAAAQCLPRATTFACSDHTNCAAHTLPIKSRLNMQHKPGKSNMSWNFELVLHARSLTTGAMTVALGSCINYRLL